MVSADGGATKKESTGAGIVAGSEDYRYRQVLPRWSSQEEATSTRHSAQTEDTGATEMKRDTKVAITIFILCMLALAIASYFGYERWSDVP